MGRIRSAGGLRKLAASVPERRQSWENARGDSARFFTESAGTKAMRPPSKIAGHHPPNRLTEQQNRRTEITPKPPRNRRREEPPEPPIRAENRQPPDRLRKDSEPGQNGPENTRFGTENHGFSDPVEFDKKLHRFTCNLASFS